ncbi:hypothetical protein RUM44_004929 [Polyplax serrata]|uniref:Uncharacterized protein n=1 Tax=Polyplax serrata TaxID=468196 RepID=A0ABR1B4P4_POLSC
MRSFQLTGLVLLAVFTVDVCCERHLCGSYREYQFRKPMGGKEAEDNCACNVKLHYKEKVGLSDPVGHYDYFTFFGKATDVKPTVLEANKNKRKIDCVALLGKATDVEATALEIQKMKNVSVATRGLRPNWSLILTCAIILLLNTYYF